MTLAAGGRLAVATAAGPVTSPLPQALVIGGTVLAVPWWAHRRQRARVRIERKLQAWPEIAKAVGLPGSQVMSALVDVWMAARRWRSSSGGGSRVASWVVNSYIGRPCSSRSAW